MRVRRYFIEIFSECVVVRWLVIMISTFGLLPS